MTNKSKGKRKLYDEEGFEVNINEIKGLNVNCFACWEKIYEKSGILFSPPSDTSSDNVDTLQKFHLCKKCFDIILEFIMGKESENYKKGMPTLQSFLKEISTDPTEIALHIRDEHDTSHNREAEIL